MTTPNRGAEKGLEPKSQKACKCGPFEADEGTRTLDLLHGKRPTCTLGEARNPSVYGMFRASRR